ncbi:XRE family transcriptional regulator [Rhodococcus sp. WS1]|uniref:helix-turn-helix domain-containing protein n=1 Tax=unclassified Rhodococcus (in: high G+C Gram-positive bacteria) TaxID=192944 RepID=UPI00114200E1|nr:MULTISPECIES: helix-turn-helix transcriptional regulator [unclassified Rhodococcus (in: high G+C Gram-positive bacteria)]ROZ53527.1 XRE family transcriptional regulator [Rhodococcus sp. WS1]TQC36767.1 XRE family transcriptional regulator [Rhodococcus sp. WS7]
MAPTEEFDPWSWDDYGWEMNFVAQMQARREAKGWSQTEFAKRLSAEGLRFHQPTVQRIESGERPLKLTEAIKIAEVLDTRLEVMLRAASVPMVYDELAEYLRPGAFDSEIRDAEMLENQIDNNIRMANELVDAYHEAVTHSPSHQVDKRLMNVANAFIDLNDSLLDHVETTTMMVKEAAQKFGALPREYPMSLRDRDDSTQTQ